MSKPFIVLGDKTSHGGKVVSACTTATTHGKPIARVGDKVTCPKCGPNTIASGDSTQIIMGKPVARHGDKTACGATLISSQSVTVISSGSGSSQGAGATNGTAGGSSKGSTEHAGATLAGAGTQSGASVRGESATNQHEAYTYKQDTHEYAKYQPAYLFVQGAGINGGYAVKGYVRVEGSTLWVNAMGSTPVSATGSVSFFGEVRVLRAGKTIVTKPLSFTQKADWPRNGSKPVGSATVELPAPHDTVPPELVITVGYTYRNAAGEAVPEPSQTRETYTIAVQESAVE